MGGTTTAWFSPAPCLVLGRNPHLYHNEDLWEKEKQRDGMGTGKLLLQGCYTGSLSWFKSQDRSLASAGSAAVCTCPARGPALPSLLHCQHPTGTKVQVPQKGEVCSRHERYFWASGEAVINLNYMLER